MRKLIYTIFMTNNHVLFCFACCEGKTWRNIKKCQLWPWLQIEKITMQWFDWTPYWLLVEIIVSPSQKNLTYKLQTAQHKCMCLCLDLFPSSHKGATYFRKIIGSQFLKDQNLAVQAMLLNIGKGLYFILVTFFSLYAIGIMLDHQWHWINL